jgi:hypothetical protein
MPLPIQYGRNYCNQEVLFSLISSLQGKESLIMIEIGLFQRHRNIFFFSYKKKKYILLLIGVANTHLLFSVAEALTSLISHS